MKKLFSLSLLIAALVLVSCGGDKKEFTVKFDSQGGTAVAEQTVKSGETLKKPADPTKENFVFGGWFKEAAGTTLWKFPADKVTSDMTLYAKWNEKPVVNADETFVSSAIFYGNLPGGITDTYWLLAEKKLTTAGSTGYMYVFDTYSAVATAVTPDRIWAFSESAEFTFDAENKFGKNTFSAQYSKVVSVDAAGQRTEINIAEGSIKLTKEDGINVKIEATLVDANGMQHNVKYTGPLSFVLPGFGKERPEQVAQTQTFTFPRYVTRIDNPLPEFPNFRPWQFVVHPTEADKSKALSVVLFTALDAAAIPTTTFSIDASLAIKPASERTVNSVFCGQYTFYMTGVGSGPNAQQWFPSSGTLTTTDTGFTLTGTSYFGSDLNFTYTGSLDIKVEAPGTPGAPARMMVSDFSSGFKK